MVVAGSMVEVGGRVLAVNVSVIQSTNQSLCCANGDTLQVCASHQNLSTPGADGPDVFFLFRYRLQTASVPDQVKCHGLVATKTSRCNGTLSLSLRQAFAVRRRAFRQSLKAARRSSSGDERPFHRHSQPEPSIHCLWTTDAFQGISKPAPFQAFASREVLANLAGRGLKLYLFGRIYSKSGCAKLGFAHKIKSSITRSHNTMTATRTAHLTPY